MNDAAPVTAKQIEDTAQQVQALVRQAADHAAAGDYRRAHTAAEQAQGAARKLKELLGERVRASAPRTSPPPSGQARPGSAAAHDDRGPGQRHA